MSRVAVLYAVGEAAVRAASTVAQELRVAGFDARAVDALYLNARELEKADVVFAADDVLDRVAELYADREVVAVQVYGDVGPMLAVIAPPAVETVAAVIESAGAAATGETAGEQAQATGEAEAAAQSGEGADSSEPSAERVELERVARELGVEFRSNISDTTLAARIEAKKAEAAAQSDNP